MTPILFSILFMNVSNYWRIYYYCGLAISITAWLSSFTIPESPSLLISHYKYDEARKVLKKIAKINGIKDFN